VGRQVLRAPLRRIEREVDTVASSPPRRLPLVGFAALQSVVSVRPLAHRFTRDHHALVVSDGNDGLYRTPSAAHLRERFHPLVSFAPPPESSRQLSVRVSEETRTPSMGLQSLFAVRAGGHSEPGFRVPTLIRPRRFTRPRRLLLRQHCGSISPRYHVQGSPPGVFPLAQPEMPRRHPVPSRRWLRSAATGCPAAPRRGASPTGLCSMRESVIPATGINRRKNPIPSWFSASSRCSVAETERRLHIS